MSVGGIARNRELWRHSLLPGTDHLRHTHDLARNAFARGPARAWRRVRRRPRTPGRTARRRRIAAVIVEPVAGSTGVLVPPKGYLERLRVLCDQHGLLLIFDEVITGFGRTGSMFAAQQFGVHADMITCAKGITNGAVPMGAVLVAPGSTMPSCRVRRAAIDLFHGYTYSGHPVACAAGAGGARHLRARGTAAARRGAGARAGGRRARVAGTAGRDRRPQLRPHRRGRTRR